MELLHTVLLIVHFIIAVCLIVVVLLQADKGSGLSGAFGGGAAQAVFGSGGSIGFLGKMTSVIAVLFMVTSFSLYMFSAKKATLLPGLEQKRAPISAPGLPGAPAPAPVQAPIHPSQVPDPEGM